MKAIEALHAVQDALRDHGLPGGAGLRERDRCFIVQLAPGDLGARPAVAELLAAMGCEIIANGHGTVYGRLAGRLLPAPPLPPVPVSSSDSGHAAEGAAVTDMTGWKRCNGSCGQWFPAEAFSWRNREKGYRGSYCRECDSDRAARLYRERKARAAVTIS